MSAQFAQSAVEVQHKLVFVSPRVTAAAEGIAVPFHYRLVAVVHAGEAEKGILQNGGNFQQSAPEKKLLVAEFRAGKHVLGAVAYPVAGKGGKYARRVVGAKYVHKIVAHVTGIVVYNVEHRAGKCRFVAVAHEGDYALHQGIVHDGIQLRSVQIVTAHAVVHLVGGVLPHFTYYGAVGILRLGGRHYLVQHAVGNFVHHVQPPALCPRFEPAGNNAVFAAEISLRPPALRLYSGQIGKAPPAVVGVVGVKIKPIPVRAVHVVIRAPFAVLFVEIEVLGAAAYVVEHAVQNNFYVQLFRLAAQPNKILVAAEHGIYHLVVLGVVLVIAVRLEHGVEVYRFYVKGGKIGQFGNDTLQIASEEVAVFDHAVFLAVEGLLSPRAQQLVLRHHVLPFVAESVHHYLIHYAAVEPVGSFVLLFVHRKLPRAHVAIEQRSLFAVVYAYITLVGYALHAEIVPVQSLFELHVGNVVVESRAGKVFVHGKFPFAAVVAVHHKHHLGGGYAPVYLQSYAKAHPFRHGAHDAFVKLLRGIVFYVYHFILQMFSAYSRTARSAENLPASAMFLRDILFHKCTSR